MPAEDLDLFDQSAAEQVDALDDIVRQAAAHLDISSAVLHAHSPLDAIVAIRSELPVYFPAIDQLPARPNDPEFRECIVRDAETGFSIPAANSLLVARKVVALLWRDK